MKKILLTLVLVPFFLSSCVIIEMIMMSADDYTNFGEGIDFKKKQSIIADYKIFAKVKLSDDEFFFIGKDDEIFQFFTYSISQNKLSDVKEHQCIENENLEEIEFINGKVRLFTNVYSEDDKAFSVIKREINPSTLEVLSSELYFTSELESDSDLPEYIKSSKNSFYNYGDLKSDFEDYDGNKKRFIISKDHKYSIVVFPIIERGSLFYGCRIQNIETGKFADGKFEVTNRQDNDGRFANLDTENIFINFKLLHVELNTNGDAYITTSEYIEDKHENVLSVFQIKFGGGIEKYDLKLPTEFVEEEKKEEDEEERFVCYDARIKIYGDELVIVGGVTDYIENYYARKWGWTSKLYSIFNTNFNIKTKAFSEIKSYELTKENVKSITDYRKIRFSLINDFERKEKGELIVFIEDLDLKKGVSGSSLNRAGDDWGDRYPDEVTWWYEATDSFIFSFDNNLNLNWSYEIDRKLDLSPMLYKDNEYNNYGPDVSSEYFSAFTLDNAIVKVIYAKQKGNLTGYVDLGRSINQVEVDTKTGKKINESILFKHVMINIYETSPILEGTDNQYLFFLPSSEGQKLTVIEKK